MAEYFIVSNIDGKICKVTRGCYIPFGNKFGTKNYTLSNGAITLEFSDFKLRSVERNGMRVDYEEEGFIEQKGGRSGIYILNPSSLPHNIEFKEQSILVMKGKAVHLVQIISTDNSGSKFI